MKCSTKYRADINEDVGQRRSLPTPRRYSPSDVRSTEQVLDSASPRRFTVRDSPPANDPKSTHFDVPRPRKVIPKLVETARHDPVRRIERLFYAIAVVDINVDIEDPWMMAGEKVEEGPKISRGRARKDHDVPKQFQDAQHTVTRISPVSSRLIPDNSHIIHITEPTRLRLLRMMQPPGPIDRNIRRPLIDPFGGTDAPTGTDRTEFKNTLECRTIFTRETARTVAG